MRGLSVVLIVVALAANANADGAKKTAPHKQPAETASVSSWDADALKTAAQLAGKLRAAGIPCKGYSPSAFGLFDSRYQKRLPLAAAITSCTTTNDEDLTFEVFKSATDAEAFLKSKQALLCSKMRVKDLYKGYPGFPYVDGGGWIVEPDEKATADKIAPILGGKSEQHPCPK